MLEFIKRSHPEHMPGAHSWALGLLIGIGIFCTSSFASVAATTNNGPPAFVGKKINEFPHDPEFFTQGLVYHEGFFLEGTGLNGKSSLRRIEPKTGKSVLRLSLSDRYFGEGITVLNHEVFQLTWKSGICFVYDSTNFQTLRKHSYEGEGWGITTDGNHLIMSDGTAQLRILDPKTFKEIRRVDVIGPQGPLRGLNELEFIEGEIWANVWPTDFIVRIDPKTGRIGSIINFASLVEGREHYRGENVLNGIAYDREGKRIFVTGKFWPKIYEIQLEPVK